MTRPPGTVRVPWLAHGEPVRVPGLTLREYLEVREHEVAVARRLGLTPAAGPLEREKAMEVLDLEVTVESLWRRLQKADPTLTRGVFEEHVTSEADALQLAGAVAVADTELRPRVPPAEAPTPGA